jgi:hypothetical protein
MDPLVKLRLPLLVLLLIMITGTTEHQEEANRMLLPGNSTAAK